LANTLRAPVTSLDHAVRVNELLANTPEGYSEWRMATPGGIRRGEDAHISDGVRRVRGRPATSFSDWAAREASVLA
jgi:hypothetical protein